MLIRDASQTIATLPPSENVGVIVTSIEAGYRITAEFYSLIDCTVIKFRTALRLELI